MKSRLPLLDLKGSIAILILVVGTIAAAMVPNQSTSTATPAAEAAGARSSFTKVLHSRGERLPFYLYDAFVSTDKPDYAPGQIVHITGGGFAPGENVQVVIDYVTTAFAVKFRSESQSFSSGHGPFIVTADGGGNFTADWLVEEDSLNQTLLLTADGQKSGIHAETTFTDASIGTYDQCSNDLGDGYPGPPPGNANQGCHWINGNLNANNSTYHEGDSTVQRAWLTGFAPGSSHSITFQYGTTKGGKHAYDYLTTWSFSENWITLDDRCETITGCTTANETSFLIPNDSSVTDTIEDLTSADRQMTIRGGTITGISAPTIVSGTYGADSETQITVTYTVAGSGSMCASGTCDVALWFGAHIARTDQWQPFNNTTGATSIPGSPYHVALAAMDGASVGNRDNQMQANAIVPPTGILQITKLTLGGFGTFGFTASPTPSPVPGSFNLVTSAQTNPQSVSFSSVPAGTYTVTESAPPAAPNSSWVLFSIACTGDLDNGNVITLGSRRVVVDLDNTEGQNCTFTNILPDARIVLSPVTANNEIGTPHTITATVSQNDQLDSGATGGDGATGFGPVPDGTLVTFSLQNNTAGATFVSGNTCTTSGGTGTCSIQITSNTVGGVDVRATASPSVLGVSLTRTSNDGVSGDGVDSHKNYVSGTVAIAANGVNEVNHQHVFTITATQAPGAATPATTANITPSVSPAPSSSSTTCGSAVAFVGNVATCTYTINNTAAGVFTVNASASFVIGGITINRTTNGTGGNSGPATKRFVDLRIAASPLTATNNVGVNHVFTFTVLQDDGFAAGAPGDATSGFGPAVGAVVNTNLLNNAAGATYVGSTSCTTGAAGTCTVTITSNTAGGVDIHAATTFSVGGVSITRATGDGLSGDSVNAHKDYVAGSLTLVKVVVNDNGGAATAASFGISSNAGSFAFGNPPVQNPTNTFTYTSNTLSNLAPATYSLHENTLTGYSEGTWGCVGAAGAVVGNPQTGSVVLAANENVTCTITNNDNPPSLTLDKIVNNTNGGTAPESSWNLTATGTGGSPTNLSGAGAAGHTDVQSSASFKADTYTLAESGTVAGYTNGTTYSCVKTPAGGSPGAPVVSNTIALANGDSAVCTITNHDNPASLRLIKALNFTHGGTRPATDWTTSAAGPTPISGAGGVGPSNVNAGAYTLSESGSFAGYTNGTTYSCVKNGAAAVVSNSISLAVGDTAVCTITNSDNAPSLILDKIVSNTHGGSAPESSWNLTATGTGGSPTNLSGAGAAGHTDVASGSSFKADTYALAESGSVAGYTNGTTYSCVKTPAGGAAGAPVAGNSISLAVGDSAVCAITNSDNPASLRLIKALNYQFGGTRPATDWTTSAAGPTPISGAGGVGPSSVNAGTYTLSETGTFAGYLNGTTYSCVKTPAGGAAGAPVSSNSISLGVGDSAVCTITNSDIAPTLKVIKLLVPTTDTGLFNLLIDGTARATNVGNNGNTGFVTVNAGSHSVSETAGTATSLDSYSSFISGDCAADGSITLSLAQNATCTITNRRLPTLIVQKTIMGQSTQFEFTATGTPTNPPNGDIFLTPPTDGSIQSDSQIIQPGTFIVNEVNLPANWLLTDFTCTSNNASGTFLYTPATIGGTFVAGFGDNVLCSFVDNQQGGTTRTQGFWATHTVLANAIWNGSPLPPGTSTITPVAVIGSADAKLCTANDITAIATPAGMNQLMGGFWANVANSTRTTKKRSPLDKIRMQFLQQYLAAVLNVHAFGTVIPGTTLATARAAYCGTDTDAIHTQQTLLATYNESGDSGIFTPGASATPGESRLEADIAFWDTTFRLFDPTQVDGGGKVNTTVTTRPTTTTKSTPVLNILVLPVFDDQTTTDSDKPADKPKVKRPVID